MPERELTMVRIVLVHLPDQGWQIFRQTQWMAKVREKPAIATVTRLHFDIEEAAYRQAIVEWDESSRESAVGLLVNLGAVEVHRG